MLGDSAESFLEAEEQANRLVEELVRLKQEVESYAVARQTLDGAAQRVKGLLDPMTEAASRMRDVVSALERIGTPQILQAQQELLARLDKVHGAVGVMAQRVGGLGSSLEVVRETIESSALNSANLHRRTLYILGGLSVLNLLLLVFLLLRGS